ncbi:MAG: TetR/AcrR family transcriptional regulator [Marmoricola sp.]|nr:TetR/AcrR family transcriptional regulator [Marmoricola sp.]
MNRTDRRKAEVRERILQAAFDLFLSQGMEATKLEDICARADVANRTFFNHFATRQDMVRALAERRLANLHDVLFDLVDEPVPTRLLGLFDNIATVLVDSGDTYREMIGTMLGTVGFGGERGSGLHDTFLELIKDGVSRGEVSTRHDPATLADIVVGALVGSIVTWTADETYSLPTGLHDVGVALCDLLVIHDL